MIRRASHLSHWLASLALATVVWCGTTAEAAPRFPNIVLVTVDTLRFDRLSLYGHSRPTSPNIDGLLGRGVHFTQARVAEPLTGPSMCSMVTSLHPHEHGGSRNGLRMRPGLPSLPKVLQKRGYRTAGFVGNWTLRDGLSGLGEHFEEYHEVFTRKRWFGLFSQEANADDLNSAALGWIQSYVATEKRLPFFVWVHYVEPHAPYRLQEDFAAKLGIQGKTEGEVDPRDRYDTEIAYVDHAIGNLLAEVGKLSPPENTLVLFMSDHGESLGEHQYWGHGRHVYDATLRIPMGLTWEGRLGPRQIDAPASSLDLAATVIGVLGLRIPDTFRGHDWSPQIRGDQDSPVDRVTYHQAHRGATPSGSQVARQRGLLEVCVVEDGKKEILRVPKGTHRLFDLRLDADEEHDLTRSSATPSETLALWLRQVQEGLAAADELPDTVLSAEDEERLRALGYLD